jgi:plasmid stabilization system protein ParE
MRYRVELLPLAERDLDEAYRWAARHAPQTAARWVVRFHEKLKTLEQHPRRCGYASEHRKLKKELRQILFGRRPNVFRAVFVIEADVVKILRIRRASRRALTKKELGET